MKQHIYDLLRQCTVRVSISGTAAHGTGFFVAPGLILTCAHVIKAAQAADTSVEIYWGDQLHPIHILKWLPDSDLALLQVNLADHPCALLDEEAIPFDTLYSYGYPDDHATGDPATFILEGKSGDQGEQLKFKTGQVRPGLSGAPILNVRTGYVCGVVRVTRDRTNDLGGRAIPTHLVFATFPELVEKQQQFHRQDRRWIDALRKLPGSSRESQARHRLLKRVQTSWISNVLVQSLHNARLIPLGLREQPDAIANPWRPAMQETDRTAVSLCSDIHMTQVYDTTDGELLILGEPGAGKTTLMLELTCDLLYRAERYEAHPIPVVFHLSFWAATRQPLTDWIVEELYLRYGVSSKIGKAWVDAEQILPLLDGLDQVSSSYRGACVEAINLYHQEHESVTIVVCSRHAEYLTQAQRLLQGRAVVVQPLSPPQIERYLLDAGEQLAALHVVLHNDINLQELATVPLMLSVLTQTYHGKSIEDIATAGLPKTTKQALENYVQRMFQRGSDQKHYTQELTQFWLTRLACQMVQHHSQEQFYIEHLQPDWLPHGWPRIAYRGIGGLLYGLIGSLSVGAVYGDFGWIFGGLIGGLVGGLSVGKIIERDSVIFVAWSLKSVRKIALVTLVVGLAIGLFAWLNTRQITVLPFGLLLGLFITLFTAVPVERLPEEKLVKPNQGIWLTGRGGLLFGLAALLVTGVMVGLPPNAPLDGLRFGLLLGLPFGLIFGGGTFIRHFILRLCLWRAKFIPWNYTRFLDYAANRILLYKVGGGYMFVHPLLRDYFASLGSASASYETPEQVQNASSTP
ncbi:MAG: hypothetical protein NVSMB38_40230 [Ktedonobacteraceae bacterium]